MKKITFEITPIGVVHSSIKDKNDAPIQGRPSKLPAEIEIFTPYIKALKGLENETSIFLLLWLHLAERDWLESFPKNDPKRKPKGVFAIRSASRPNPIGLHLVDLLEIKGNILKVAGLEAIESTPVIDIKPFRSDLDNAN